MSLLMKVEEKRDLFYFASVGLILCLTSDYVFLFGIEWHDKVWMK